MKAYAVLRGFPGLGRVMSGMEILRMLRDEYGYETRLFTYFNGEPLANSMEFEIEKIGQLDQESLTSIGILPVGPLGANLIKSIIEWNPDIVIVDGEPLLIKTLSMVFPVEKIVALVNPCDIENLHTPISNNIFFRDSYLSSGITICHGFSCPQKTYNYHNNKLYYINTILSNSILKIKENRKCQLKSRPKRISCVLGGGTKNAPSTMFLSTIEIGKKVIESADYLDEFCIDLFTNDDEIANELDKHIKKDNVKIHREYCSSEELYMHTDIVICRSGRNTVSELIYLGIPALLISAGSDFRGKEQMHNIIQAERLSGGTISGFDGTMSALSLSHIIKDKIKSNKINNCQFIPGNEQLKRILKEFLTQND